MVLYNYMLWMDHYMIVITFYFHAPNYHRRCTESHLSGPPEQQGICPPVLTDLVDGPSQALTAHPRVKPRDRHPTRSVSRSRQPRADVMSPADFTGKYSGATLEISISEIICSWLINVTFLPFQRYTKSSTLRHSIITETKWHILHRVSPTHTSG